MWHARLTLTIVFSVLLAADAAGTHPTYTPALHADPSRAAVYGRHASLAWHNASLHLSVSAPSTDFTTWVEGDLIRVEIPANWRELLVPGEVTFAPDGAYGHVGVPSVFTHGIAIGLAQDGRQDLSLATTDFINTRLFGGPGGPRVFTYHAVTIATRPGIHTTLTSMSPVTGGLQRVEVFATGLGHSVLLYVLTISPVDAESPYAETFRHIVQSITLLDVSGRVWTTDAPPLP